FNAPIIEYPDGRIMTGAHRPLADGRWRQHKPHQRGDRWEQTELRLLHGRFGMHDPFRTNGDFTEPCVTYVEPVSKRGCRFDHCFVSPEINAAVRPVHDIRLDGLSNHSALEVNLTFAALAVDASPSDPGSSTVI